MQPRTIIVSGVSKAYAMTGWRIGWTLATPEFTAAMDNLQSQETSNPCSISQHAAIAALLGPQDSVEAMRQEFSRRRDYAVTQVRSLPRIQMPAPGGAFYVFFNVSEYFGKSIGSRGQTAHDATEFCSQLLDEAHVALVTGDAFGAPGYVRLSFAASMKTLETGFDRIRKFLSGEPIA